MKSKMLCVLICVTALSLTGCKNHQDIEDDNYVLAMGFETVGDKYLVRYSFADFNKASSDSGMQIPSRSITYLAKSLEDANSQWNQSQEKSLNFGHLKVVIFGGGKKDKKIVKELQGQPQIAKSVFVLESERNLYRIFEIEKKLPISFGEYMANGIQRTSNKKSVRCMTLGHVL